MKKNTLWTAIAFFICTFMFSQNMTLTLENAQITNDGIDDFYEVDVMISSDADFTMGSGQFLFTYNNAAFGLNVSGNGNIFFDRPLNSALGSQTIGIDNYNLFVENDNTDFRASYAWDQFWSAGTIGVNITATPTLLLHMRIRYLDSGAIPDVCFDVTTPFDDQFFSACGPFIAGTAAADCLGLPGTQILDYTPDCTGGVISTLCAGITTYTIGGGWDFGAPDASMEAIIAEDYSTSIANIDACRLVILGGATLTVEAGGYLNIVNDIDNDGILDILDQGSVVQIDDNAAVLNTGFINVEKQIAGMGDRDFLIGASPMTLEDPLAFGLPIQFRNHLTGNFIPNPDVEFDFPLADNFADDNGDNWLPYNNFMNPGEGYLVMPQQIPTIPGPADYVFNFTQGTLNNGEVLFDVLYNGTQNGSPNMLGNPYPSAIDADVFMALNPSIEAVYFWEHLTPPTLYPGYNANNYNMGDLSVYSALMGGNQAPNGGDIPDQFIASGQGFGLKATVGGPATFNNSMRVTGNNDDFRRSTITRDRVWVNVYNDTYQLGSTTLIGFSNVTTDGFDRGGDIKRLASPVSLYQELTTGEQLAIQGRSSFDISDQVPVSFSTQVEETQSYRISIYQLDGLNMSEATVYLIDKLLGEVTNLSEQDYTFTANAGTYANRFTVVFEERTLENDEFSLEANITVYPNPTQNILHIHSRTFEVSEVAVFDIRGRMVQQESGSIEQIDLSKLNSAIYFVKISTESGSVTKRIIKE